MFPVKSPLPRTKMIFDRNVLVADIKAVLGQDYSQKDAVIIKARLKNVNIDSER